MIRAETPADHDAIAALTEAAFAGAAHSDGNEAKIIEGLRAADALSLSLVYELAGEIVGHIAFSPVAIGGESAGWLGLGPMSVSPEYQKQGIGAALIGTALERLKQDGVKGVVVLGDPQFYTRFGFRSGLGPSFAGVPPEYFMALGLDGRVPAGAVDYHPAFFA